MLVVPIVDGDRLVLAASFGGDERHPGWYLNLQASPEVRATFAGSTRTMIARISTEEERAELWPRITSVFEGYARYQERTERPIPVIILEPKEPCVGWVLLAPAAYSRSVTTWKPTWSLVRSTAMGLMRASGTAPTSWSATARAERKGGW
jgi:deazaflavin-dependent oxidoreductase (nitroreductase family)